jgi:hypothetical protein
MAENIQSYDKKEYLFSWKALLANIFWFGPSFVNRFSFSEIYTGSVVARDLQVNIKIAIENSLLSKLPYETIYIRRIICQPWFVWVRGAHPLIFCVVGFFSVPSAQCCLCLWIVPSVLIVRSGFSNVHCVNWHIKEVI